MKVPVPDEILPADRLGRVHFVGIGGAGLSGIARIMLARGIDGQRQRRHRLADPRGAARAGGPGAPRPRRRAGRGDADTLVVSTAVREDNPEYVEAVRRGLRVLPRSAALAAVMAGRRVVAVAGTHGKTTTTSLLTVALQVAGADPTYAIGGDLTATGVNAADGAGDVFVAEADESDGAFLHYAPYAAIVTNIEADHLDHWGTEEAYRAAFDEFADTVDPDGFLVCCVDDPGAAALAERQRACRPPGRARCRRASPGPWPASRSGRPASTTSPTRSPRSPPASSSGTTPTRSPAASRPTPGPSGGWSARARPGACASTTATPTTRPRSPATSRPRGRWPGTGRLVVAFQPHLVSRTRIFGAAMGAALGAADEVVVLDVYLAREDADPEVTGALVAGAVPLPPERVAFVPTFDDVAAELVSRARPGDLVLTLGAGTVTEIGPRVLERLADDDR